MSWARRVLFGLIWAIAGWSLGIPALAPTSAFDYDDAQTPPVVLASGGTRTDSHEVIRSLTDAAADARSSYDDASDLARAFARLDRYGSAPNTAGGGLRTVADEVGEVRSYPSYRKAQADLGTSSSSDIHHIVEQCQCSPARSGFSVSRVNSTDNMIRIPGGVHDRISAYYASRPPGFSTTVRNTLNGMPFEQQYDFGLDVIRRAMGGSL